jgi:hypothetical protein
MPTAYYRATLTLAPQGGGPALFCGSRGIEIWDWAGLTIGQDSRGPDLLREMEPGRLAMGRLPDDTKRIVELRLYGEWTDTGTKVVGYDAKVARYYAHLAQVRATLQKVHTASLAVSGVALSSLVTVERLTVPRKLNPWSYEVSMDLTVHGHGFV